MLRSKSWTHSGWTLIELTAVMVLLAILTAGAAFTLRGPLRAARQRADIAAVLRMDRAARVEAKRNGSPIRLEFCGNPSPSLTMTAPGREESSRVVTQALDEPPQIRSSGRQGVREQATIGIDANGRSQTYAVGFRHSETAESWIVIAGGTGQVITALSKQQVYGLLGSLRSPAP